MWPQNMFWEYLERQNRGGTILKYENGKDIFPERLLKQIQKYVSGKLVYIPSPEEKKKDWGEASGYRQ